MRQNIVMNNFIVGGVSITFRSCHCRGLTAEINIPRQAITKRYFPSLGDKML